MDKRLNLVVDLINRTEKGFKKVYSDLDATQKKIENTTKFMKQIGLIGGVALTAVGVGATKAIKAASDLEESINAVNVVFGEGADEIENFGKKSATAVGLSTAKFNQMATITGALLKDTGLDMNTVADATTDLATRAADMASVFNTDVNDAMSAINQAIRGETEAIRRYAGDVTDASLQTYLLSQGIDKQVTSMTEQEKRLYRVELIMKQTAVTQGDFANTSDSVANSQRIMAAQAENMSAALGTQLIPAVKKVYEMLTPLVTKMAQWIDANPELAKNIVLVVGGLSALAVAIGIVGVVLAPLITAFKGVGMAITAVHKLQKAYITINALTVTATKLMTLQNNLMSGSFSLAAVKTKLLNVALFQLKGALLATGIGAVILLAGFLVTKFFELKDAVGGFGNAFKFVWLEVKKIFYSSMQSILEGLDTLFSKIPGLSDLISDETIAGFATMKEEVNAEMDNIVASVATVGTESTDTALVVDEATAAMLGSLGDLTAGSGETSEAAKKYFEDLVSSVTEIRDEIKDAYDEIAESTANFQKSIGQEQMSYEEDVANSVAEAYEKKKELERELKEARKEDDNENEVAKIKAQLDEQEEIIRSYKDLEIDLADEIAERRKYLRANEIEQLTMDHEKKLMMMQKEYLEEQVASLKKIVMLNQEHATIMALLDGETRAKLEAEISKSTAFRTRLAEEKTALGGWMGESKAMYTKYVQDVNSILGKIRSTGVSLGGSSGKSSILGRATGGSVQPNRTFMVGEKGPELFTPDTYGRIAANGSGTTVVVNFSGNHFTDERYAEEIQRKIMTDLKRALRISIT